MRCAARTVTSSEMTFGRPPAVIDGLVDVAVITCQIAAAVDLEDDLAERNQRLAYAGL
jgi:hypothetical protein